MLDSGVDAGEPPGDAEERNYKEVRQIGAGAFGRALLMERLCEPNKGGLFVIKQINVGIMDDKGRKEAQQEMQVLSQLRHPYIIGYHTYFVSHNFLNIVMEFAAGGDLAQRIKAAKDSSAPFAEDTILVWLAQIASALAWVHSNKIIHRDIKTGNIFLTEDNVAKLGDFGIAKVLGDTVCLANTVIGTPYYMSPELCESVPYSYKSDVWALGCVLYEMTCLRRAFDGPNVMALVLKILRGSYPPVSDEYSPELKELVHAMLRSSPAERPSVAELLKTPVMQRALSMCVSHEEYIGTQRLKKALPKLTSEGGSRRSLGGSIRAIDVAEAPVNHPVKVAVKPPPLPPPVRPASKPAVALIDDGGTGKPISLAGARLEGVVRSGFGYGTTETNLDMSSDSSEGGGESPTPARSTPPHISDSSNSSSDEGSVDSHNSFMEGMEVTGMLPSISVPSHDSGPKAEIARRSIDILGQPPSISSPPDPLLRRKVRPGLDRQGPIPARTVNLSQPPDDVRVVAWEHSQPVGRSELLSPAAHTPVAPNTDCILDEYSGDSFAPEDDNPEMLPDGPAPPPTPAVLHEMELSEATVPAPFKPSGIPPPPKFEGVVALRPPPPPILPRPPMRTSITLHLPEPSPEKSVSQPPPPLPALSTLIEKLPSPPHVSVVRPPPVPPAIRPSPPSVPPPPLPVDTFAHSLVATPTTSPGGSVDSKPGRFPLHTPRGLSQQIRSPHIGSIAGAAVGSPGDSHTQDHSDGNSGSDSESDSTSADEGTRLHAGHKEVAGGTGFTPRDVNDFSEDGSDYDDFHTDDSGEVPSDGDAVVGVGEGEGSDSDGPHSVPEETEEEFAEGEEDEFEHGTAALMYSLNSRLAHLNNPTHYQSPQEKANTPAMREMLKVNANKLIQSTGTFPASVLAARAAAQPSRPGRVVLHSPLKHAVAQVQAARPVGAGKGVTVPTPASRLLFTPKSSPSRRPPTSPAVATPPFGSSHARGRGIGDASAYNKRALHTEFPRDEVARFAKSVSETSSPATPGSEPQATRRSSVDSAPPSASSLAQQRREIRARDEAKRTAAAHTQQAHLENLRRAKAAPSKLKEMIRDRRKSWNEEGAGGGGVGTCTLEDLATGDGFIPVPPALHTPPKRRGPRLQHSGGGDAPVVTLVPKGFEGLMAPAALAIEPVGDPSRRRSLTKQQSLSKGIKTFESGLQRLEAAAMMKSYLLEPGEARDGGELFEASSLMVEHAPPHKSQQEVANCVEQLREQCESELGMAKFKTVYNMLQEHGGDIDAVSFQLLAMGYALEQLVHVQKLVDMERTVFSS